MTRVVSRLEDMSAIGHLRLLIEDDGDIIIACYAQNQHNGLIEHNAGVQFCTTICGGGGSPETFKALHALFKAMEKDNADPHRNGRKMIEDQ